MSKLKFFLVLNTGGVWGDEPDGNDDVIVFRSTEQTADGKWFIKQPAMRKLSASEKFAATLKKGDLLVTKSSGSPLHIGKTTLVDDKIAALKPCYSNFMQRLRVDEQRAIPRYIWYQLNSEWSREQLSLLSNSTTGLANLNGGILGEMSVRLPLLIEQRQIATYLNRETAKIDKLIAKQQKLIKLLQEKRQAVISQAVTKGLDPTVKMKDSGVEWLGEVPDHWVVSKIKFVKAGYSNSFVDGPFGSNLKSEHFIDDGDAYVIESNFATTGKINFNKLKTISDNHFQTISRSQAFSGSIVIAKIGARFGSASILPPLDKKAVVSGNSLKLDVDGKRTSNNWIEKQLKFLKWSGQIDLLVNGSAQPALSLGGMNQLSVLIPPISEQELILSHLEFFGGKIDALIKKCECSIELLKEHRQALITAAVTGKIDVRGFVTDEEVAALDADPVLKTTEEDLESEVAEADYITEEE
ncbi:restriction endonuclease subunit S [Limnobacter thiooxidans]